MALDLVPTSLYLADRATKREPEGSLRLCYRAEVAGATQPRRQRADAHPGYRYRAITTPPGPKDFVLVVNAGLPGRPS